MKALLFLITFLFLLVTGTMAAFGSGSNHLIPKPTAGKEIITLSKLSVKELQVYLGRKLTLKERVQWVLAKKVIAITDPGDEERAKRGRSNAYTGFALGLASILLFPLFAIPGLIISNNALAYEKEKPGILGNALGFAKAGQIMSWVGIVLTVLVVILVLVLLNSFN